VKAFILPTIFTAVDQFTSPVNKMNKTMKSFSDSAFKVARNTAIAGAAILAPMVLAANSAVKFEDKMADVAKTTQIAGADLRGLGDDILDLATKTRTPIEGLQDIARIAGEMGVTGRANVLAFTNSVDKFNIALGSDFSGGVEEAARGIGGLNTMFKESRALSIADSITKTGSAINALTAKGARASELSEFMNRIGQLPDAIKPSIQDVAALGAVFRKLPAEISARAMGDVLIGASQNTAAFAKQMNISADSVKHLLNTDPTQFLKDFSKGLQGMNAVDFAKVSKDLKIVDSGSLKVIGTLSNSIDELTGFQVISNQAFAEGSSIAQEAALKNATAAGQMAIAKNNFEALSITIGTELIPMVNDLLKSITPIIKGAIDWVRNNKELTKTFIKIAIGVSAFMFVLSALSTIFGVVTAAVAFFSLALWTCPLTWIVLGIVALIAVVVAIIVYWKEWGSLVMAFFAIFAPGIALIISLVMSFYNNWQMIVDAFSNGGILDGLLAIGKVLLDVILSPLQQVLEVIAKITGADWAASAANGLKEFRADLGLNVGGEAIPIEAVNPNKEKEQAISNRFEEISRQQLDVNINDPAGRSTAKMGSGPIPIKLSSTHKFGN